MKYLLHILVLLSVALPNARAEKSAASKKDPTSVVVGRTVNLQHLPIEGIQVKVMEDGKPTGIEATSRDDGWFVLEAPKAAGERIKIVLDRRHFARTTLKLSPELLAIYNSADPLSLGSIVIEREKTAAFWITLVIFLFMLILIGATPMHNALASLVGASLLLAISALGHLVSDSLIIYHFTDAVSAVDWNVVFLFMGMMIVIAVIEGTGVFRWLAYFAYKTSGGKMWKLVVILMLITAVSSAVLDNVTTMLLMTPISIRIALAMDMDPLVLLMPEVLAANVGGLSTMVGTPTNILIASYSGISFSDFLINLTPGVIMALVGVAGYCLFRFRKQLKTVDGAISKKLRARLEQGATITQPVHLKKAGWVGLIMLLLFIIGEHLHIPPAVIALLGATGLLVWIKPDVEEMIEAVDWTTLVFFITLFMVIGALAEVGLIDQLATWVGYLVGDSFVLAMVVITWLAALISTVIPNVPFTATMLPVIGYLTASIPDAHPQALYFCLAVGAAMGGNGSLIGASANLVTAGIAERSGYPITFGRFFKVGFPAMLITVSLAFVWLLIRYAIF